MAPSKIVETLYVIEDFWPSFIPRVVDSLFDLLTLQVTEERFSHSVIPATPQYCGHEFQSALTGYKMKSSMSCKGDCWNNALKESLCGRLKVGRLYGRKFTTLRKAMDEVIDWITLGNHR